MAIHGEHISKRVYEEYAYVLDFLPQGRPSSERLRHVAVPSVQVLGENYFTILEAELKYGASVSIQERVYIGRERREKVDRIIGRISYDDLTVNAKAELPVTVESLVKSQEKRFVDFFNLSQPVTPRMHSLELLPGIGKKSMWLIVKERERKPFLNFSDVEVRTKIPVLKTLTERIIEELRQGQESKYRIFTRTF